jgi:hypothetical protein
VASGEIRREQADEKHASKEASERKTFEDALKKLKDVDGQWILDFGGNEFQVASSLGGETQDKTKELRVCAFPHWRIIEAKVPGAVAPPGLLESPIPSDLKSDKHGKTSESKSLVEGPRSNLNKKPRKSKKGKKTSDEEESDQINPFSVPQEPPPQDESETPREEPSTEPEPSPPSLPAAGGGGRRIKENDPNAHIQVADAFNSSGSGPDYLVNTGGGGGARQSGNNAEFRQTVEVANRESGRLIRQLPNQKRDKTLIREHEPAKKSNGQQMVRSVDVPRFLDAMEKFRDRAWLKAQELMRYVAGFFGE